MADPIAALGGACAALRPGGPADAIFGVVPAAVARPGTVAEASELMRAASGHGLTVLPCGNRTKLTWGTSPARCDLVVDTTALDKIIDHAAGDLVVRVQAGLAMARLAAELSLAGQELALDPPATPPAADAVGAAPGTGAGASGGYAVSAHAGAGSGTVGGVIATSAAGPRRLRYGAPRDLLIGITVVLADGTVASSGGKVVKNVAGYDLGKLFAGSFGTLGLIAEAAFRLHPLPQAASYVTTMRATASDALTAVRGAIESQLVPSAAEIDRPEPGSPVSVCVLLEGAADAMTQRVAGMRNILGPGAQAAAAPPAWWGSAVADRGATALRIAFPPAALPFVLDSVDEAAAGPGTDVVCPAVRGSAGAGLLEVGLDAATPPNAAASFVAVLRRRLAAPPGWGDVPGASVTVVRAPPDIRDAVDVWGPVTAAELMRAVKDQFDPGHVLSPGRFAGGI